MEHTFTERRGVCLHALFLQEFFPSTILLLVMVMAMALAAALSCYPPRHIGGEPPSKRRRRSSNNVSCVSRTSISLKVQGSAIFTMTSQTFGVSRNFYPNNSEGGSESTKYTKYNLSKLET